MKELRIKVLAFLRNLPKDKRARFTEALAMYRSTVGQDAAQYTSGFSDQNLNFLIYDLQKLHAITDLEVRRKEKAATETLSEAIASKVAARIELLLTIGFTVDTENKQLVLGDDVVTEDELLSLSDDKFVLLMRTHQRVSIVISRGFSFDESTTCLVKGADIVSQEVLLTYSDEDFFNFINSLISETEGANVNDTTVANMEIVKGDTSSPDPDKKEDPAADNTPIETDQNTPAPFVPAPDSEERKSLRDEFPFLDDEDCPVELRTLATDKVTAYRRYVKAHNKLQAHRNGSAVIEDESELQETIKSAVEDYEANRAIYDEFNYYAAKGKILGTHPMFKALALQREVADMNNDQLLSFINSSPKFFSTKKSDIEKAKGDKPKIAKLKASVDARTEKLKLVKKALNLSGK